MHVVLCELLRMFDRYPLLLSAEQANDIYAAGMRHLRLYAYLHREVVQENGNRSHAQLLAVAAKAAFFVSHVPRLQRAAN